VQQKPSGNKVITIILLSHCSMVWKNLETRSKMSCMPTTCTISSSRICNPIVLGMVVGGRGKKSQRDRKTFPIGNQERLRVSGSLFYFFLIF